MKKILLTLEIDKNTALALKFIEQTRGVRAEDVARNMVENCAEQSINQGPGECVEGYIEGALLYEGGAKWCEWTAGPRGSLEKLGECKKTLIRINKVRSTRATVKEAA